MRDSEHPPIEYYDLSSISLPPKSSSTSKFSMLLFAFAASRILAAAPHVHKLVADCRSLSFLLRLVTAFAFFLEGAADAVAIVWCTW